MKNEKGYALLIVLFLVVVIMVISTTFVSASVSNAKQGKTVDENNLSVVAAEMGVDYYKTAIVNEFNKKKVDMVSDAQVEVNNLVNSAGFSKLSEAEKKQKLEVQLEVIRQNLISSLENHFNRTIPTIHYPASIDITMNFEKLDSAIVGKTADGVKIEGVITGRNEQYLKDLDFDMTFKVPKLKIGGAGSGSGSGTLETTDFENLYPDPIPMGLSNCVGSLNKEKCIGNNSTSLGNIDSSTLYFPDGISKGNGNLLFNTNWSEFYSNSNFEVYNVSNMNGATFFVNGSFDVDNKAENMNNSLVKINGSFSVRNELNNMNNTTFKVNGPFSVGSNMQIMNNTKICVNGPFTVEGDMNNMNNLEVYVNGSFTVGGNISNLNNSKIYVYNQGGTPPAKHMNKITELNSSEKYYKECEGGGTTPSLINIEWDDRYNMNVIY